MTEREANPGKVISTNRKARHEYTILETVEAGVVLTGTEVKSLRQGNAAIAEGYAEIRNGEVWLVGVHINPYKQGSYNNVDPLRERKLLLHQREIRKLQTRVTQRGLTLVPLRMYFLKKRVKVEIALVQGKKAYDKRQDIARREAERSMRRQHAR